MLDIIENEKLSGLVDTATLQAFEPTIEEKQLILYLREAFLPLRGWLPIETCQPFNGMIAYVGFPDGFWGLARYCDFISDKGKDTERRIQFWSLSDFHHDRDIYKYYGNQIDPDKWYYIPFPIPEPHHAKSLSPQPEGVKK